MSGTSVAPVSTTRRVTANSFWYGLDSISAVLLVFLTSIPLARALGPERLGYFNYVGWLCGMGRTLGNMGVPGTASRFIALYLRRGQGGKARAVFGYAVTVQAITATVLTLGGCALVLWTGDSRYRAVSLVQVATILPTMIGFVATWANMSSEELSKNVFGGLVADAIYLGGVWMSLVLGWGLVGVATAMLVAKTAECLLRFRKAYEWIRVYPEDSLSAEEKRPMFRFAGQQLYMGLISATLWSKSDVVLLKWLSSDIRQVTFFTLAYNIIEKVVMLPDVIGSAMSTSMVAQMGDKPERAAAMTATATRYMFLLAAPLLFGSFLVARPIVRVLYGVRFVETAPILAIGALLAIVKPLLGPVDGLFRATGRQTAMLICASACTIVNVVVDLVLIPRYGAIGAAIGNGVGQGLVVITYLVVAVTCFDVALDYRRLGLTGLSAAAMAGPALLCNHFLPAPAALACDVAAGAVTYMMMLRVTGVLEASDAVRVTTIAKMLPSKLHLIATSAVRVLIRPAAA